MPRQVPRALALILAFVVPLVAGVAGSEGLAHARSAPGAGSGSGLVQDVSASFSEIASDNAVRFGGKIVLAIVIFIAGWTVAKLAAYAVYQLLSRTRWDNWLADKLGINMLLKERGASAGDGQDDAIERATSQVVYYLLMAFVVVAVLEYAGLSQVAGPIERLVDTVIQALPVIGKAVMILTIAYFAAWILRLVVTKALDGFGLDRRFAEMSEETPDADTTPFSAVAGRAVFWLVMLVGLASAADTVHINPIADPLHNAIDAIVSILPRIGFAAVLVIVGYIVGRIARVAIRNALQSLGFDKLVAKIGLDKLTGNVSPSDVVGGAVMIFIIVQMTITALGEIGVAGLSQPLINMMAKFWAMLPNVVLAGLIVAAGVFVGGLLRRLVATTLRNVGFDGLMSRLGFGPLADREDRLGEYSELVAFVVQIAVILLALTQALAEDVLNLTTWATYLEAVLAYVVKNLVVATLVVGIGFAIGNYVRDLIAARGEGETGRWLGEFARYAILVFAFTMAVRQLDVAEDFVLLTFGLLFGALCLAAALAFGLGGREVAGQILRERYQDVHRKLRRLPTPAGSGPAVSPATRPPTSQDP